MSSIATTNETSNVTSLPTAPKPQTTKEVIAANVKLLIEQLEAGHSEGLTAYLTAMGRFHRYSFSNVLEIARQMPSASRVAGMHAWNQLGRKVKKGSKGIRILAPVVGIRRKKDSEAEKSTPDQNEPVLVGFRSAYVFDVSMTDGSPLPELEERVTGDVGVYRERLIDFILAQGIELEFKESIAPALGMSYGGKIVILPGQSSAEEFSTLVHEASHELIHKSSRRTATTKTVRETEAEAIAFVVGTTIGLDNGRSSASYIQIYHGNAALLAESLDVVKQTSDLILSAIETPVVAQEQTEEKPTISPPPRRTPPMQQSRRWRNADPTRLDPFRSGADTGQRVRSTPPQDLSTRTRRAIMQNSNAFQFLALDTIHESASEPNGCVCSHSLRKTRAMMSKSTPLISL